MIRLALMCGIAIQIFCVLNPNPNPDNSGIEMTKYWAHKPLVPSMLESPLDKEITEYIKKLKDNANLETNVKMQLHKEGAEYKIRFAIKELFKCFENKSRKKS